MAYRSLQHCVADLEKTGQLLRIREEVSPELEMAEIHRRVYDAQGPAILYERVKGSPFRALSNLYGTPQRTDYIFRDTLQAVQKVIALKADPTRFLRNPSAYWKAPLTALTALPRRSMTKPPILYGTTTIDQLPMIKSWQMDGGAFVTLPQVFTQAPNDTNLLRANVGMYRIQLSGNEYIPNKEIGLHYQLHRGIGVHHQQYNQTDQPFKVSIFVGGLPSHAFAAIMPLPEGLSELTFAGLLGGRRFRYTYHDDYFLSSDADFVITGTVQKNQQKPEGPFGDHLGYYSLTHPFPVMNVHKVHYRKDAIWHFTVVGRPPQEDSSFGYLIHKLVKELTVQEFPGVKEIHAVDAAGVHPLLLAVGSERYMPFRERKPEEILTAANRILGSGQTSLAKYLFIAADDEGIPLSAHNPYPFLQHILRRVDWSRDLHFHTRTTIDTLDYSGTGWNEGSKLVVACCGTPVRTLAHELPTSLTLPHGCRKACVCMPGVLAIQTNPFGEYTEQGEPLAMHIAQQLGQYPPDALSGFPLVVLCDDAAFTSANLNNFLWVTFTRSNPSHDVYGVRSTYQNKHWGCRGSLIIDARTKPHHAPALVPDPHITERVNALFGRMGLSY